MPLCAECNIEIPGKAIFFCDSTKKWLHTECITRDPINRPAHYTFSKYEVLDVLEDWNLPAHLWHVIEYCVRAGRKNQVGKTPEEAELEDLRKAKFYLDRYISIKERACITLDPKAPKTPASR